jgi:hypothetical protein
MRHLIKLMLQELFASPQWATLLAKIDLITQQNVKIMAFFDDMQALLGNIDTAVTGVGSEIAALNATIAGLQAGAPLTTAQIAALETHATNIATALTALEPPVVTPPVAGS